MHINVIGRGIEISVPARGNCGGFPKGLPHLQVSPAGKLFLHTVQKFKLNRGVSLRLSGKKIDGDPNISSRSECKMSPEGKQVSRVQRAGGVHPLICQLKQQNQ